jgi:effector-binding domain-containing protein
MLNRLYEVLISMAIVAVLFLLVGVFLPSSRTIVEQVETNRHRTIVFDTLNGFKRFTHWNPLVLHDPEVKIKVSGPEAGVGARLEYSSQKKDVGNGSWEITQSEPDNRVVYALDNRARGSNKTMEFSLKTTGNRGRNIEITQKYNVEYGWDLLGRYSGLYVRSTVGEDMKIGLSRLAGILASVPNVDYRVEGSKLRDMTVAERPAENLLVVFAGAVERNNLKIQESMKANTEWIKRVMEANGLVAAGPMRIVTAELGREAYTFDVAMPVRKRGSGEDDSAAAADDGELKVEIPSGAPVQYVRTEPGRVAMAKYTGYMAELENVRNALRAWAMTQGLEIAGRPYENYLSGIEQSFTENGEYEVFWPIK